MNISSIGSSVQYATLSANNEASAAVVGKVLDQEKTDGQNAVQLIDSADPKGSSGHSLSVYA
jgi:hypothetical protein